MDIETILYFMLTSFLIVCIIFLLKAARDLSPIGLTPSEMKWIEHISSYYNASTGIQISDFAGDLKKTGPYTRRIKLPINRIEMPHYHLDRARTITVISGTLYFAYGDKYDESKLKAFPAGSFITEPRKVSHFVVTKNEEVILQISGLGPSKTVYLDNKKQ